MGKKIPVGPALLVAARHAPAQEATVAHVIRAVYTLSSARDEKPAEIRSKTMSPGGKTDHVEFACIRTTAGRNG